MASYAYSTGRYPRPTSIARGPSEKTSRLAWTGCGTGALQHPSRQGDHHVSACFLRSSKGRESSAVTSVSLRRSQPPSGERDMTSRYC